MCDTRKWQDFYTTPDGITWQRRILYFCDPAKSTNCMKTHCKYHGTGECDLTLDESCAMRSAEGWPLVRIVLTRTKTGEGPDE